MIMAALAGRCHELFFTMFTDHSLLVISDVKVHVSDLEQRGWDMQVQLWSRNKPAYCLLILDASTIFLPYTWLIV